LRERNKEVQRLKKQVEQLEASQAQRQAGTVPPEQDASTSASLLGSPGPASPPRPHLSMSSTGTASDWMRDYLQAWEPPAEPEEQSFWELMDDQLEATNSHLLDVDMIQDSSSLSPSVPEPVVACKAVATQTSNPMSACSHHHTGDLNVTANKSSHMPIDPPLSHHSRNPIPSRTPPVPQTVGPTDRNLHGNHHDENGLGIYMADVSTASLDPPPLANDLGPLTLHRGSQSASSASRPSTMSQCPSCRCQTGHTSPSTPSASLPHGGGFRRADQKPPETNTLGPQLPFIHGLVLGTGTHVIGEGMTIKLQQTNLTGCAKLVTLLFQYGSNEKTTREPGLSPKS
jgi:hypothetical protein